VLRPRALWCAVSVVIAEQRNGGATGADRACCGTTTTLTMHTSNAAWRRIAFALFPARIAFGGYYINAVEGQFLAGFEPASDELKFVARPLSYRDVVFGSRTLTLARCSHCRQRDTCLFSSGTHTHRHVLRNADAGAAYRCGTNRGTVSLKIFHVTGDLLQGACQ
jgi:hypothetical protein